MKRNERNAHGNCWNSERKNNPNTKLVQKIHRPGHSPNQASAVKEGNLFLFLLRLLYLLEKYCFYREIPQYFKYDRKVQSILKLSAEVKFRNRTKINRAGGDLESSLGEAMAWQVFAPRGFFTKKKELGIEGKSQKTEGKKKTDSIAALTYNANTLLRSFFFFCKITITKQNTQHLKRKEKQKNKILVHLIRERRRRC